MSVVYLLSVQDIDPAHIEQYGIDGERVAHIREMHKADDRRRSIGASLLLKQYLSKHGRTLVDVQVTSDGKPYVEGLHFSIAHSGTYAALAVSDTEIGIDIEVIRPLPAMVMERKFNKEEQSLVLHSDHPDEMFMRIWTAKEAYLKMKGTGIRINLAAIDTCHMNAETTTIGDLVISVCTKQKEPMKIVLV